MDFVWVLHHTIVILIITTVTLCVGSFLGMAAYRLPHMILQNHSREEIFNLWLPFSFCPQCRVTLRFREMIPIFSYLFLRGQCSSCKNRISWNYVTIECLTLVLTLLLYYYFGWSIYFIFSVVLLWSLIVLAFIDLNTYLLPDCITIPLVIIGLIGNSYSMFVPFREAMLGAILSYLLFDVLARIFYKIRKIEVLGRGDFKLIAVLGAWFGFGMIPGIILLASVTGLVVGFVYIVAAKQPLTSRIPFGPFLGLAGMVALFWTGMLYQKHLAQIVW